METQILIVEDSETQALQLRYLLEEEGWEVIHASTAESALEELNRRRPSLIIADYHLPGVLGDELCRRIRMNVGTRGIPILMLTAEDTQGSEPAGLDSGADSYLAKSIAPGILLLRVRALLRNSEQRSSSVAPHEVCFRRTRLLAIDDSPTYLECLAETFSGEGYQVTLAASALEGLERIAHESFDCVLVDLIMPEIDGIEVCRRINEIGRDVETSMVVVVMLTSSESKEDMTRALEAGADDFVGKSSEMTILKARIRALLRRKFFQEDNRRIREQLLRKELEASEARAARVLAETRAHMVDELERKNRDLEAFSYSVSHDLRAPLRSIDGFSKALLEDYADKLDAQGLRHLSRVRAAAQRMGELIDDLLELSKVGRRELQVGRVNLSALAQSVALELQRATPERQVGMKISEGITASCDPRLFRIVFENLMENAWKFTKPVAAAVVEFGIEERKGVTTYFVRDNGVGFDMTYAERLFTPFQRLHSEAEFPGTGIGLATVYRIVERHGGQVWAESAINRGAVFLWTLPA